MRIIFRKGENVQGMMQALTEFMLMQSAEYPLLKDKTEINIDLKNSIGQICQDNERTFYCDEGKIVALGSIGTDYVDWKMGLDEEEELDCELKDQWREFVYINTDYIEHEIERDKNYIATANDKGRDPKYVELRRKNLVKNENRLKREMEKKIRLNMFIEKIRKNEVGFRYERDICGEKIKVMIFEQDGDQL